MDILPAHSASRSAKAPAKLRSNSTTLSDSSVPSKNLVVVRAGPRSLHRDWNLSSHTDQFDVVVSYYGDGEYIPAAGESVHYFKGGKFEGIFDLFQKRPELMRDYTHIWIPDDDIGTNIDDIAKLFDIAKARRLQICQPSLSWKSYHSHFITLYNPHFELRYTNFVEMMAPVFTSDALRELTPLFEGLRFGWGLDEIWCRLLPAPEFGSAIIDAVTVDHMRPLGSGALYETAKSPRNERLEFFQKIGIGDERFRPKVYAGLDFRKSKLVRGIRLWHHLYSGWKGMGAAPAAQARLKPMKILKHVKRCAVGECDLTPININLGSTAAPH